MRDTFDGIVESGRVRTGTYGSPSQSRFGAFRLERSGTRLQVIASDGSYWEESGLNGERWEHVSVSVSGRTPTWAELQWVKTLFWKDDETVIQIHPPDAAYVNLHPNVLHLWRPTVTVLPLPPLRTV